MQLKYFGYLGLLVSGITFSDLNNTTVNKERPGQVEYLPSLTLGGARYFHSESNYAGIYHLWSPLWYNQTGSLFFTDLRAFDRSGGSFEGNIHLGYRNLDQNREIMWGLYGGFDQRRSSFKNQFQQLVFGGELWLGSWFIGGNFYQPLGRRNRELSRQEWRESGVQSLNKETFGNYQVFEYQVQDEIHRLKKKEEMQGGGDFEVGYAWKSGITNYLGSYYFKGANTKRMIGGRTRITYEIFPKHSSFVERINFEGGIQYDNVRHTIGYLGLTIRFGGSNDKVKRGFERHMEDLVRRDPDIVVSENNEENKTVHEKIKREWQSKEGGSYKEEEIWLQALKDFGMENYSGVTPREWEDKLKKRRLELVLQHHPDRGGIERNWVYYNQLYELIESLKNHFPRLLEGNFYNKAAPPREKRVEEKVEIIKEEQLIALQDTVEQVRNRKPINYWQVKQENGTHKLSNKPYETVEGVTFGLVNGQNWRYGVNVKGIDITVPVGYGEHFGADPCWVNEEYRFKISGKDKDYYLAIYDFGEREEIKPPVFVDRVTLTFDQKEEKEKIRSLLAETGFTVFMNREKNSSTALKHLTIRASNPRYSMVFQKEEEGIFKSLFGINFSTRKVNGDRALFNSLKKEEQNWENLEGEVTEDGMEFHADPELYKMEKQDRHYSSLDKFVFEHKDPLILISFVQNQIKLDQGLVNPLIIRTEEDTFLDRQGTVEEQNALLIYLLRAVDESALLVKPQEKTYLTLKNYEALFAGIEKGEKENTFIPLKCSYVKYFDREKKKWIDIFPWLKDKGWSLGKHYKNFIDSKNHANVNWIENYLEGNLERGPFEQLVSEIKERMDKEGYCKEELGLKRGQSNLVYSDLEKLPKLSVYDTNKVVIVGERGKIDDKDVDTIKRLNIILTTLSNQKLIEIRDIPIKEWVDRGGYIHFQPVNGDPNCLEHWMILRMRGEEGWNGPVHHFEKELNFRGIHEQRVKLSPEVKQIKVTYQIGAMSSSDERSYFIERGVAANLGLNFNRVSEKRFKKIIEDYEQLRKSRRAGDWDVLGEWLRIVGLRYFQKTADQVLEIANMSQLSYRNSVQIGLSKLSPDLSKEGKQIDGRGYLRGQPKLVYPQVDMVITFNHHESDLVENQLNTEENSILGTQELLKVLITAGSYNEHATINEMYPDQKAISTVKLLNLAHQRWSKTNLDKKDKPGYLTIDRDFFNRMEKIAPETKEKYFDGYDLLKVKKEMGSQWEVLRKVFNGTAGDTALAFITPGLVNSEKEKDYRGCGSLIFDQNRCYALISGNNYYLNGGYGSHLNNNFQSNLPGSNKLTEILNNPFNKFGGFDHSFSENNPDSWIKIPFNNREEYRSNPLFTDFGKRDFSFMGENQQGETVNFEKLGRGLSVAGKHQDFVNRWFYSDPETILSNYAKGESFLKDTISVMEQGWQTSLDAMDQFKNQQKQQWGNLDRTLNNLEQVSKEISSWQQVAHKEHRSFLETAADPVDLITGAYLETITDLEVRLGGLNFERSYHSQGLELGVLGYGWSWNQLSGLKILKENEGIAILIQGIEADGTTVTYRRSGDKWQVYSEDNMHLSGEQGVWTNLLFEIEGGYLLKNRLGEKREYRKLEDKLVLISWETATGDKYQGVYEGSRLVKITSQNGWLKFNYEGDFLVSIEDDLVREVNFTIDQWGDLARVDYWDGRYINYSYQHYKEEDQEKSRHLLIKKGEPLGKELVNLYNPAGQVLEQWVNEEVGQKRLDASFDYIYESKDSLFSVRKVRDPAGKVTEYKLYDGMIYQITDPLGAKSYQSWYLEKAGDKYNYLDGLTGKVLSMDNFQGRYRQLKEVIDWSGIKSNYRYNELGLKIEEKKFWEGNLVGTKTWGYNEARLPFYEKNQGGDLIEQNRYFYEDDRLVKKISEVDGVKILEEAFTYANGKLIIKESSGTNKVARVEKFKYDSRGYLIKKLVEQSNPITEKIEIYSKIYHYDQQGGIIKREEVDGSIWEGLRNDRGQIVKEKLAMGANAGEELYCKQYFYDLLGRLDKETEDRPDWVNQRKIQYIYNPLDQLLMKTELKVLKGKMVDNSNLLRTGKLTNYRYNYLGQIIEQGEPDGTFWDYSYSMINQLLRATHWDIEHKVILEEKRYIYDLKRNLVAFDEGAGLVERTYEGNQLVEEMTEEDYRSFQYDGLGRLIEYETDGDTWRLTYNSSEGSILGVNEGGKEFYCQEGDDFKLSYSSGCWTSEWYDALGRIIGKKVAASKEAARKIGTSEKGLKEGEEWTNYHYVQLGGITRQQTLYNLDPISKVVLFDALGNKRSEHFINEKMEHLCTLIPLVPLLALKEEKCDSDGQLIKRCRTEKCEEYRYNKQGQKLSLKITDKNDEQLYERENGYNSLGLLSWIKENGVLVEEDEYDGLDLKSRRFGSNFWQIEENGVISSSYNGSKILAYEAGENYVADSNGYLREESGDSTTIKDGEALLRLEEKKYEDGHLSFLNYVDLERNLAGENNYIHNFKGEQIWKQLILATLNQEKSFFDRVKELFFSKEKKKRLAEEAEQICSGIIQTWHQEREGGRRVALNLEEEPDLDINYRYNAIGQIINLAMGEKTWGYSYDLDGVMNKKLFIDESEDIAFVMDISQIDEGNKTISFEESFKNEKGYSTTLKVNSLGKIYEEKIGEDKFTMNYDNLGRLTNCSSDNSLESYSYEDYLLKSNEFKDYKSGDQLHHELLNRTGRVWKDKITKTLGNKTETFYIDSEYDGMGQLIKKSYRYLNGTIYQQQWLTWDSVGNLVGVEGKGKRWYGFYDCEGKLISSKSNKLEKEYFYDPEGGHTLVGIRVNQGKQSELLKFVPKVNLYGRLDYLDGIEGIEIGDEYYQLKSGAYSNVVKKLEVGGQVSDIKNYSHSAYGFSLSSLDFSSFFLNKEAIDVIGNSFYVGHLREESGFINFGARYYDPELGRFISPDPLGHDGSRDLYSYAKGDPVNYRDYQGYFALGAYADSDSFSENKNKSYFNYFLNYNKELWSSHNLGIEELAARVNIKDLNDSPPPSLPVVFPGQITNPNLFQTPPLDSFTMMLRMLAVPFSHIMSPFVSRAIFFEEQEKKQFDQLSLKKYLTKTLFSLSPVSLLMPSLNHMFAADLLNFGVIKALSIPGEISNHLHNHVFAEKTYNFLLNRFPGISRESIESLEYFSREAFPILVTAGLVKVASGFVPRGLNGKIIESVEKSKGISSQLTKDPWAPKNIPTKTILEYIPGLKECMGESSLGEAVYTRNSLINYFKEKTRGMGNGEKINFLNNFSEKNFLPGFEAVMKEYGPIKGPQVWNDIIDSKSVRRITSAAKNVANKAGAQEHHLLPQGIKVDVYTMDPTFKLKTDPLNLVYLPENEALAKQMGVSKHSGRHTKAFGEKVVENLKKIDKEIGCVREHIVEKALEERRGVLSGTRNLYEKTVKTESPKDITVKKK